MQRMHGQPFPNDHLDAFFNASLDAGIAMAFFMAAAEAEGLGCCPISTVRNHLDAIADLCALPDHVFPVAGLAVGLPVHPAARISPRLGLDETVHIDRFRDTTPAAIESYDQRRKAASVTPPAAPPWSEAKARMYATPQRTDFATFARKIGFNLD
jgi:nitroreductase/FMN reductase [NAD(P)H]